MYEDRFSLASINQVVQSGGSSALMQTEFQEGGVDFKDKVSNFVKNVKTYNSKISENIKSGFERLKPKSTGEDISAEEPSESSVWKRIKLMFIKIIESILNDFKLENWKKQTQYYQRPMIWALLSILAILLMLGGMILSAVILGKIVQKRKGALGIKLENRYNIDLPEYLIARSKTLSSQELPFKWLIIMPILAIVSMGAIVAHKFVQGDALKKAEETDCQTPLSTGDGADGDNKEIPTLPFGIMFIVGVFSLLSLIIIVPTYLSTQKKLKAVRNRIEIFEKEVFNNMYIEQNFLNVLYNGGIPPDNLYDTMNRAIRTILVNPDGSINKTINTEDIEKMVYTLRLYEFLYDDLRDNDTNGKPYRTQSMELFNYKLLALPGSSKIFRIADFMRSNIAPNMIDNAKLMNIVRGVGQYIKLKEPTITKIQMAFSNTYNKAFNLRASKAWNSVKTLTIVSFVAHWFVILCVIAYLIGILIYKKFFQ